MKFDFIITIELEYFETELEQRESTDFNGINFDICGEFVECSVEIDHLDFEGFADEYHLCEWLGFDSEKIAYTNWEYLCEDLLDNA